MKRIRSLICLLLCLALLPVCVHSAQAESTTNIRVYLKRLALTDRADLWLDGVYTAGTQGQTTIAFPYGSQVTVQIRSDEIYLFYDGMSIRMGDSVRFTQNRSTQDGWEGIRFAEDGNLYPGILEFTIFDGQLRPILTLPVEDYLIGVVPYEMANDFPLEALKAQAVCARTYALARANSVYTYDLVDTTADQVFKGIDPSVTNAIRAIEETAGIVGMYKGKMANCYYSASNGGQTELVEHVWSQNGDWGYYAMVDDPYDLENPKSSVRRVRLNKDGSKLPTALNEIISSYMAPTLLASGYDQDPASLRVDKIISASLGRPRFGEPSKMMTELTLTFNWSGRRMLPPETATPKPTDDDQEIMLFASPTPIPEPESTVDNIFSQAQATPEPEPIIRYSDFERIDEPCTLTIQLFPDFVDKMGLSIYGADNEIITLMENDQQLILEARRYGHGVGMSQRGAQWMALRYNKTYTDILNFYYPGMEIREISTGAQPLPTAPIDLISTLAPPATPTPRPTLMPVTGPVPEGGYLAVVANIDDDSSLNLRTEPTQSSEILRRLYKHQQLIVIEVCEDPAWVHVRTDVVEGYVMVSFLATVE